MRTLNILSIDLDWFNYITERYDEDESERRIEAFFAKLTRECTMPLKVAWMREHQYLYPWTLRLLRSRSAGRVNVINVDEHHDFYYLSGIEDFKNSSISCADFFGFMIYDGILNKYDWVNNGMTHTNRQGYHELLFELDGSSEPRLRRWSEQSPHRLDVHGRSKIWRVIGNKTFDGVAVIESPEYTKDVTLVSQAAKRALRDEGFDLKEHKCTADFRYSQRKKVDMRPLFRAATMA